MANEYKDSVVELRFHLSSALAEFEESTGMRVTSISTDFVDSGETNDEGLMVKMIDNLHLVLRD